MLENFDALSIARFHDQTLAQPDWPLAPRTAPSSGVWKWIDANHRYNTLLWNEEDKARRTDVDAEEIAHSKRLIDRYNQKRNDAVEAIDEAILIGLQDIRRAADARLNSETAGAMIDRLSILSLKIFHMRKQTRRTDAGREHVERCSARLNRLQEQRNDLSHCLDALAAGMLDGSAYFKMYRQFKMYNDPALNPYLYGKRDALPQRGAAQ